VTTVEQLHNPRKHRRGKHIEHKYHLIREIIAQGDVVVTKPFTKILPPKIFESHLEGMRIKCMLNWN
jgi:hypothetical protein